MCQIAKAKRFAHRVQVKGESMNIGILSMQRIPNYGSFLQSLSLKKQLERLSGGDVYFIDIEEGKHLVPAVESSIAHGGFLRKFDRYFFKRIENYLFSRKMKFIHTQDQIRYLETEKKLEVGKKFDLVIIGSDEVFNAGIPSAWGFSTQLFGNIKNAKWIVTYAASCGQTTKDITDKYGMTNDIAIAMDELKNISVRDKGTFKFVQDITGRTPEIHLDPVFLTDFDEYIPKLPKRKPYLLVYAYGNRINDEAEIRSIRNYAKNKGLEILSVGMQQRWCKNNITANGFELLSYVKGAACIVTDTFHGTVFSIKYNKPFAVFIRESNKNKISGLLSHFGLMERAVQNRKELHDILQTDIDLDRINNIIEYEQKRSEIYLRSAIINSMEVS